MDSLVLLAARMAFFTFSFSHFVALLIVRFFFFFSSSSWCSANIFIRVKAKAIYCHLLFALWQPKQRYIVHETVMCNMFIATGATTRINLFNFLNCSTSACWIFYNPVECLFFSPPSFVPSIWHPVVLLAATIKMHKIILLRLHWWTTPKKIIFWLSSLAMKQTTTKNPPCSHLQYSNQFFFSAFSVFICSHLMKCNSLKLNRRNATKKKMNEVKEWMRLLKEIELDSIPALERI